MRYISKWGMSVSRETDSARERLRQNHHHSGLWAVVSGLIPRATDRFLSDDCVLSLPGHPIPNTGTPFYLSHAVADLRCRRRVTY